MQTFLVIFALNALSYFLLTLDIRWVSESKQPHSTILAFIIGVISFTVLKDIQAASGFWPCLAYATGGMIGTWSGIVFEKRFFPNNAKCEVQIQKVPENFRTLELPDSKTPIGG